MITISSHHHIYSVLLLTTLFAGLVISLDSNSTHPTLNDPTRRGRPNDAAGDAESTANILLPNLQGSLIVTMLGIYWAVGALPHY